MRVLLFLIYWAPALFSAQIYDVEPSLPAVIETEANLKAWVEKAVHDCPPVGGEVTMIKHWPPHYAKNDKVGEIWVVPSVVKVKTEDGKFDHEMAFVVYRVDTNDTKVSVLFKIQEEDLEKYLHPKDEDST
jgi:hypothetical protein